MSPPLFLITVYLPTGQKLNFKLYHFTKKDGRVQFIDRVTGSSKDYPYEWCAIENIEEVKA